MADIEEADVDDSRSDLMDQFWDPVMLLSEHPATADGLLPASGLPFEDDDAFVSLSSVVIGKDGDDSCRSASDDEYDAEAMRRSPWLCSTQQVTTVIVSLEPPVQEQQDPLPEVPVIIPPRGASPSTFYGAKAMKHHAAIRRKYVAFFPICIWKYDIMPKIHDIKSHYYGA